MTDWQGADDLRPHLRPIEALAPHPKNPKRGDVDEIAASLARWGQERAILVREGVIVAGNHTWLAARKLGWTEIAAVEGAFANAEEARDYLLADNRLGDLATSDQAELRAFLEELDEQGSWAGTGYRPEDLDDLRAQLDKQAAAPPPELPPPADPMAPTEFREFVLLFTDDLFPVFGENLRKLRERYGLEGVAETVMHALRAETLRVHQEEAPVA